MSTQEVARDLVALCKQGKFIESGEKYWADNIVSVEPMGEHAEIKGKAAVHGKSVQWEKSTEVHSVLVEGPYVHGNQFVVRFKLDMTNKESGKRQTMDEVGVYTVRNDKITEERFFYGE
jgi:hypothetical protein